MVSDNSENIKIDESILKRIHNRVIDLIYQNLKTQKDGSSDISDKIRKIIEFEVSKSEN